MRRSVIILCSIGLLTACAGRPPAPVAVVQPVDDVMSCEAIHAEINRNNERLTELGEERGAKVAQNVAAGIAGAIFILPLFLMDFQGAASTDARALEARNQYLATLVRSRCANPQAPAASAAVPAARR